MAHTPTRPFSLIKAFCERPEVDAIFKNARKFSASSRKCIEKPVSALRLKALRPPVYYVCCLLLCRPHRHKVLWSGLSPKARKKLKKTLNRQKYVELRTKKAHGHYSTEGVTLDAVNVFLPGYGTAGEAVALSVPFAATPANYSRSSRSAVTHCRISSSTWFQTFPGRSLPF